MVGGISCVSEALLATTGMTTLFRDRRRPILGASNHLVFSFVLRGIVLIAGVKKTQETFHRHFIQSIQLRNMHK